MPPMKKRAPAANPDAYVEALGGWQRELVLALRAAVRSAAPLQEVIKWGHLVYFANGPVLLIRAEDTRVLFGFWRGQKLMNIEPRLKPGGKYEMATLELREGMTVKPAVARNLAKAAIRLNATLGDPTLAAKAAARSKLSPAKPKRKPAARVKAKAATAPKTQRNKTDYSVVRDFALALPDVREHINKLGPGLKAKGRLFAWPPPHKACEANSLAVRIGFDEREGLLSEEPDVYYLIDHYLKHPIVLVRLGKIKRAALKELLKSSWQYTTL
jgi:hypothetical protein